MGGGGACQVRSSSAIVELWVVYQVETGLMLGVVLVVVAAADRVDAVVWVDVVG